MSQPLFDQLFPDPPLAGHVPLTGEQRKESAFETVLISLPEEYRQRFGEIVKGLPTGYKFTVENITQIIGRPPDGKSNAVGPLISGCARKGLIKRTGFMRKAQRPGMNATELSEWVRL